MKIKLAHIPYITNKISLDMLNCGFIKIVGTLDEIKKIISIVLENNANIEKNLEAKANELLEEKELEIDMMQIDRRNMFWLIKKNLAEQSGFELNYDDRFNKLAHNIMDKLIDEDIINFNVSENRVKNVIFNAIDEYLKSYSKIEDIVYDKISNYKREIVPGSEEYELIFEKLYQEELRKLGMF